MNAEERWIIRRAELEKCQPEIDRENRSAFRLLSLCGLSVSVMNYFVQLVVVGEGMPLFRSGLLFAYFSLLLFIDRCVIPEDKPVSTPKMYLALAPMMLLAALLGTVWDTSHEAVTILMFMMFLPGFVIDYPLRFLCMQTFWTLVFAGLCLWVKKPPILYTDLIHALEFYVASCGLMYAISIVRLQSLQRQMRTKHHLTHDPHTDCQNWLALEEKREEYCRRDMLLVIGELDRLTMVNDFYGIDAANSASRLFTHTLMDAFGKDNVYIKSGTEVFCVSEDTSVEECARRIKQCRKAMHAFSFEGKKITMTSSFGYVTGNAENTGEFSQMVQLAEIYLHQAESVGNEQIRGSAFGQEVFRTAAAQSNTSSAKPYEISPLTGMPRLYYFTARTTELLENVVDVSRHPVIGFIRLTKLREYNDSLGYTQGDELIKETARQLRNAFYSRVLCHVTAGQFCVLCYRGEAETGIRNLCESLSKFSQGAMADCKAGFAEYTGTEQVVTLIDRARLAQKSIVSYRDQHVCFYDNVLDEEIRFSQYIVNHLDEAVEKRYLTAFFQPIVRAATGEVCYEEALVRWNDPNYGLLLPYRFIPTLEENALMYKVNLCMVELVLENLKRRRTDGVPIVPVSINLSRKDFTQCDMVHEITSRVEASGFPRSVIRIEITESAFVTDQELLKREIARFRENGFKVWLDDFGSEYSTLNLLEEIDFDLIKIDMQFMKNFTGEGKNYVIVAHTIAMARQMGMVTLTEGVENREQLELIKQLNCDLVQGYFFNKPNPYEYIAECAQNGTGLPFEKTSVSSAEAKEKGLAV